MFSESSPCLLGQHGSCSVQPTSLWNSKKTFYKTFSTTWRPRLSDLIHLPCEECHESEDGKVGAVVVLLEVGHVRGDHGSDSCLNVRINCRECVTQGKILQGINEPPGGGCVLFGAVAARKTRNLRQLIYSLYTVLQVLPSARGLWFG